VHVSGSRKAALLNVAPAEVGYMNVIPKCIDATGKYPLYENLPDTYAAINAYLSDAPLEGQLKPLSNHQRRVLGPVFSQQINLPLI